MLSCWGENNASVVSVVHIDYRNYNKRYISADKRRYSCMVYP